MTRLVTFAATQMACDWDVDANIARAERLVRAAAEQGANVVLLQELFATPYFPITQDARHFRHARPLDGHPMVARFSALAAELGVVLPLSVFERAGQAFFNAVAVIDADGTVRGVYRKSHIPQAPAYEEKYYFSPGDTGFRVWRTQFAELGIGICWDQWFPETGRSLALLGAEALLFPTAIGTDVSPAAGDSCPSWRRVQQGQAAANLVPLIASNRIGVERADRGDGAGSVETTFYGASFICDERGAVVAEGSRDRQEVVTATFDLDAVRDHRERWLMFRDRRPELYGALTTLDGQGPQRP
jgi:N-carbamoylputrescine amidase